jgi:hypothetical protein
MTAQHNDPMTPKANEAKPNPQSEIRNPKSTLCPMPMQKLIILWTSPSFQVGLGHNSCPHPLGNTSEFQALTLNPNASDLARRDLICTLLEFSLAQDVDVCQCFTGFGSEPPQTGHIFSVALIRRLALHLEHLTGWSFTRCIFWGSGTLFIALFLYQSRNVWPIKAALESIAQLSSDFNHCQGVMATVFE